MRITDQPSWVTFEFQYRILPVQCVQVWMVTADFETGVLLDWYGLV